MQPPVKKSLARCLDKVRYSDELGARAAASCLCTTFDHDQLFVYKCPHCLGWHATRKPTGDLVKERVSKDDTFIADHKHAYGVDDKCTVCHKPNPALAEEEVLNRWKARRDELVAEGKQDAADKCLPAIEHRTRIVNAIRAKTGYPADKVPKPVEETAQAELVPAPAETQT